MKVQSFSPPKITTGLDVGDRYTTFCTLQRFGEIEEEGRIRTTPEALRGHFEGRERARVALEVGSHSPWVSRLLKELGHEVLVASARKLRLIYDNDNKGDPVDAESLARVARLDPKLLAPIEQEWRGAGGGRSPHPWGWVTAAPGRIRGPEARKPPGPGPGPPRPTSSPAWRGV